MKEAYSETKLNPSDHAKCKAIIHSAAAGAGAVGAGLAQIPMSDSAIIVPIQITMVISLGRLFGVDLSNSAALGLTMGATATFFGRATSQILLGWVPVVGNALNAATAAGLTEVVGWSVVSTFQGRGTAKL